MLRFVTFNIWNVWRLTRKAWNRDDLAAEILQDLQPDIFCLQEFDAPFRHEEQSLPKMMATYSEVAVQGVDADVNWNPIFYVSSRFRLLDSGHHVYSVGTEYPYREHYRSHFRTLTWGVLEDRTTGKPIAVMNTHYDTDSANLKSESDELISISREIRQKYDCPILAAGDYNCPLAGEAVRNMLAVGFRDTCALARYPEGVHGCHPYPILNEEKQVFDCYDDHFYHTDYAEAIDHVLLLGDADVELYRTVINEKTLLVSDHSPVLVVMSEPTYKSVRKGVSIK